MEAIALRIIDLVESIAASPPFVCVDRGSGHHGGIDTMHATGDRLFELVLGTAADDGEGGCISARVRVEGALRLRYSTHPSLVVRRAIQLDDVRRIRDALDFAPASWAVGTAAIICGPSEPSAPPILADGATVPYEVVSLPLTIIWEPQ